MAIHCPYCQSSLEASPDHTEPASCPNCNRIVAPGVPLPPGTVLGDFRIKGHIGSGAMAHVFLAEQISLRRDVAVKTFSRGYADGPEAVERFIHEIQLTASLSHPNLVTAFVAGEEDDLFFIAMTFVEGDDLDQILEASGRFAEKEALRIIRHVAAALDYAWTASKVIHRDIKPGNIKLDKNRVPKLLDLGIARSSRDDKRMTLDGLVIGTPYYMSPEQAKGTVELDCRSDIYSMGATLYHLVVGEPPFDAPTSMAVLTKHITDTLPPARRRNPKVSDNCSALLERMMAKDPDQRPPDWATVIRMIDNVISGRGPHPAAGSAARAGRKKSANRKKITGLRPMPAVRQRSSILSLIPIAGLFVLIAVMLAIIVVVRRSEPGPAPDPAPPSPPPVANNVVGGPAASRVQMALGTIAEFARRNPNNTRETRRHYEALVDSVQGANEREAVIRAMEAYAAVVAQHMERIVVALSMKAQSLINDHRYDEAAQLFENYTGPLAEATRIQRLEMAAQFQEDGQQYTARMAMQYEQDRQGYQQIKAAAVRMLLIREFRTLKSYVNGDAPALSHPDFQRRRVAFLESVRRVLNAKDLIAESFRNDVNKIVKLNLSGGSERLKLAAIRDGKLIFEKESAYLGTLSREIDVDELTIEERLKRLGGNGASSEAEIIKSLIYLHDKNRSRATAILSRIGSELSGALLDGLESDRRR